MYIDKLTYEEQLSDNRWISRRSIILKRDNHKCKMCGVGGDKDNPLHIHHRYYKFGALAWQYNNNALITLCRNCHAIIHKTYSPLCYYVNDNQLIPMNFTPCERCNGAGWFPEYKHVQGGICFRCDGRRYEELIDKNFEEVHLEEYFSEYEDRFDLLDIIKDSNEITRIFQQGIELFEKDINESENIKNAYKNFRKAALNGYALAQNYCGLILNMKTKYNKKDYNNSLKWFVYAAMQGNIQSKLNLYTLFNNGVGGVKNLELANEWLALYNNQRNNNNDIPEEGTFEYFAYEKHMEERYYEENADRMICSTWTLREFLNTFKKKVKVRFVKSVMDQYEYYYHNTDCYMNELIIVGENDKRVSIYTPLSMSSSDIKPHLDDYYVVKMARGGHYLFEELPSKDDNYYIYLTDEEKKRWGLFFALIPPF